MDGPQLHPKSLLVLIITLASFCIPFYSIQNTDLLLNRAYFDVIRISTFPYIMIVVTLLLWWMLIKNLPRRKYRLIAVFLGLLGLVTLIIQIGKGMRRHNLEELIPLGIEASIVVGSLITVVLFSKNILIEDSRVIRKWVVICIASSILILPITIFSIGRGHIPLFNLNLKNEVVVGSITDLRLYGVHWKNVTFSGVQFKDVQLYLGRQMEVDYHQCKFQNVHFEQDSLRGCKFLGSDFENLVFKETGIREANFSNTFFKAGKLTGGELTLSKFHCITVCESFDMDLDSLLLNGKIDLGLFTPCALPPHNQKTLDSIWQTYHRPSPSCNTSDLCKECYYGD